MCFSEFMMQTSIQYYLLLFLGILGIFFELFNPGLILPGLIGFMALSVALYALQALPLYSLIFVLIVLGVVFFVGIRLMLRSQRRPIHNGVNYLMGASGKTLCSIDPRGQALIQGEIWSVYSALVIQRDRPIKVIAINGIYLEVEELFNEGEE